MLSDDCCLCKGGNHAISGRVWRAQFSPFTVIELFLAASSKKTVRVSERWMVDPRCVPLGVYYCISFKENIRVLSCVLTLTSSPSEKVDASVHWRYP